MYFTSGRRRKVTLSIMKKSIGIVKDRPKFTASLLESYPNLEDTNREPETDAPVPDDAHVIRAKVWVEENEL